MSHGILSVLFFIILSLTTSKPLSNFLNENTDVKPIEGKNLVKPSLKPIQYTRILSDVSDKISDLKSEELDEGLDTQITTLQDEMNINIIKESSSDVKEDNSNSNKINDDLLETKIKKENETIPSKDSSGNFYLLIFIYLTRIRKRENF